MNFRETEAQAHKIIMLRQAKTQKKRLLNSAEGLYCHCPTSATMYSD